MLLPHIIEYNSGINVHSRSQKEYPKQVEKYVSIARLLGLQNFNTITTVRALVNWVQFMNKEMNIPLSVSQMGNITEVEYRGKIPGHGRRGPRRRLHGDQSQASHQGGCHAHL